MSCLGIYECDIYDVMVLSSIRFGLYIQYALLLIVHQNCIDAHATLMHNKVNDEYSRYLSPEFYNV